MSGRYPARAEVRARHAGAVSRWRRAWAYWPALVVVVCLVALGVGLTAAWRTYENRSRHAHPARVEVAGKVGAAPIVSLSAPLAMAKPSIRVVQRGSGAPVREGQPVLLQLCVFDGNDGSLISAGHRAHLLAGTADKRRLGGQLLDAVRGRSVGSRLALRRPVEAGGDRAQRMEIDVVDILPTSATGRPQDTANLPLQGDLLADVPTVSGWGGDAPGQVGIYVLKRGEGAQVGAGDTVALNYGVWKWGENAPQVTTWAKGPQLLRLRDVLRGLRQAVPDQRVGSRLLVTLPPEQARGDAALAVIIDVLAANR